MSSATHDAESIFWAALHIQSPQERARHLDQACASDRALRAQVEAMLAAYPKVEHFLERPAAEQVAEQTSAPAALTESIGTTIGPYKLLQRLGEGGMGVVYVAEQTEPVKRRVALKVIKPGMDTAQVIARFEAERQALAIMDHTNIAKVLDAGTTDTGRPYFVMELVKGVPITKYCDELNLPIRERLALFVPVCQAIQHAHQKGIIHRDVKPTNVLIAMQDGKPVPKVIDFGVAKALHQRLTDRTMMTEFGAVVGTLEYMAPEQAELSALDIDTRADVYGLGVLLYELLTGSTPLDKTRLRNAAYSEMLRMIREEEPPKPSTRLTTAEELPSLAARRRTESARLTKLVRGELDWIVMKCLEKDRTRRYETANGLARDVERYLSDAPVEACPPSAGYRLKKVLRRNKGPALAAAVVLLTLVVGIVGTTWGLIRAENSRQLAESARERETARAESESRERRRAETAEAAALASERQASAERDRAEQETRVAQAVKDFLQNRLLDQADPRNWANALLEAGDVSSETNFNPTIRELLDRAAAELTPANIEKQFPNLPLVQAEILRTIGSAYEGAGKNTPAIAHLERSRDLYVAQLGPDHPETLTTMFNLAVAHRGTPAKAIELLRQVIDRRRAKFGPDHPETLVALNELAREYRNTGKRSEAVQLYEQVSDQRIAKLGADHADTLDTMQALAWAYMGVQRHADAIRLFEQVRDQQIKKLGPVHPDTLLTQSRLALTYGSAGRHSEALQLFEQLHEPLNAKLGPDRTTTLTTLRWHADVLQWTRKYPEAIKLYEQVRDGFSAKVGPDHDWTLDTQSRLGHTYQLAGRVPEAIQLLERVRDQQTAKRPDHRETLDTLQRLAGAYRAAGRLPAAIQVLEQVRDRRGKTPEGLENMNTLTDLASAYQAAARLPDAIQLLEQARDQRLATRGPDHLDTLGAIRNLARVHWTAGNLSEACQLFEHVRDRYVATLGPDHSQTLASQRDLAFMYRDAGKLPEALQLYEEIVPRARRVFGPGHETTRALTTNWCFTLDQAGQFGKSAEIQRELLKTERERFPADSPRLAGPLFRMGHSLLKADQFAEAEPVLRECLHIYEQAPSNARLTSRVTSDTKSLLGWSLLGQQKYAEAEPLLLAGYEGLKQTEAEATTRPTSFRPSRLPDALQRLINLYTAWDKPDQAAKWREVLDERKVADKPAVDQTEKP